MVYTSRRYGVDTAFHLVEWLLGEELVRKECGRIWRESVEMTLLEG